jgi:pimeloyl-ACP methyl ester carboxylesterase
MSILLVHGAWHGAWCWEPVIDLLPGARAIDLPSVHAGGGFADDVAAVRAALDGMEAPVTLVGHSYGGAVISEAGTHPNVGHLVYLTAFALDVGETVMANGAPPTPPSLLNTALRIDGDEITVDPALAGAAFYADCAIQPIDRLKPMSAATFLVPITEPAWRSVPSTYVLCTLDQALDPDLQRFLSARCTTTVELEASHSPMLSMPDRVAEIISSATA